jgi:hypothetical protein
VPPAHGRGAVRVPDSPINYIHLLTVQANMVGMLPTHTRHRIHSFTVSAH